MAKEPKVDDLGIEIDEEIEQMQADPKTALVGKFLDYRDKRKAKEAEIAKQKADEEAQKNKKSMWD